MDTGIDVQAGDAVSINANGQIRVARDGGVMSAAGVESGRTEGATMPTANVGGLVARFGDSAPLFIGERRTFRTAVGGRLYLGVNDNFFDDNTGEFTVTVTSTDGLAAPVGSFILGRLGAAAMAVHSILPSCSHSHRLQKSLEDFRGQRIEFHPEPDRGLRMRNSAGEGYLRAAEGHPDRDVRAGENRRARFDIAADR